MIKDKMQIYILVTLGYAYTLISDVHAVMNINIQHCYTKSIVNNQIKMIVKDGKQVASNMILFYKTYLAIKELI